MLYIPCGLFVYGIAVTKYLFRAFRYGDRRFGVFYAILVAETRMPVPKDAKNSVGQYNVFNL